jgi:hypothetical protein
MSALDTSPTMNLDLLPPKVPASLSHVAPSKTPLPLNQASSPPNLDQQDLPLTLARSHQPPTVGASTPPLTELASIRPRYDILPPGLRVSRPDAQDPSQSSLTEMSPSQPESPTIARSGRALAYVELPSRRAIEATRGKGLEDVLETKSSDSKDTAVIGLAAMDESRDSRDIENVQVKAEAPEHANIDPISASKPAHQPQKMTASKPSEGSSDKRFLCYICMKLFTRRRSVRDHVKKIHNASDFDMARAIEVTVDPDTGEPVTPLADLVKTGPAPLEGDSELQRQPSHTLSCASSIETNGLLMSVAEDGQKSLVSEIQVAQSAASSSKKGPAKSKSSKAGGKKAPAHVDTSIDGFAKIRSPSGTPISSRASRPPSMIKSKKHLGRSLASSPMPSERMSVTAATDLEAEDEAGERDDVQAEEHDESQAGSGGEVFCICRKGDNHTWMIGCDGGCEDWFHGKCVNIEERDGDLIDKYLCPNCEAEGRGQTTWKRMCRRPECRKPARVLANPPSKYCSGDCSKRFWVGMVQKSDPDVLVADDGLTLIGSKVHQTVDRKKRKRHTASAYNKHHNPNDCGGHDENIVERDHLDQCLKSSYMRKKWKGESLSVKRTEGEADLNVDAQSSDEECPLPTRGGALSVGDVRMILDQAKTVDEIRHLGRRPPTPPYTSDTELDADKTDTRTPDARAVSIGKEGAPVELTAPLFAYSSLERSQLDALSSQIHDLQTHLQLLQDQETLLGIIKARSTTIIEKLNDVAAVPGSKAKPKNLKNICGFDPRLSWCSADFASWRISSRGIAVLEQGEDIGDPEPECEGESESEGPEDPSQDSDSVAPTTQQQQDDDKVDASSPITGTKLSNHHHHRGICIRSKCPRHRDWRRLVASEVKFEEEAVRRRLKKLGVEKEEVRERAAMRVLSGGARESLKKT